MPPISSCCPRYEGYGMALGRGSVARAADCQFEGRRHSRPRFPPDAGILVPPGDVAALTEGLRRVLTDADLRSRLTRLPAPRP